MNDSCNHKHQKEHEITARLEICPDRRDQDRIRKSEFAKREKREGN